MTTVPPVPGEVPGERDVPLEDYGMVSTRDPYLQSNSEYWVNDLAMYLRKDPVGLEGFVRQEEKRLRDAIQIKIAADYKLSREVHLFEKFATEA